MFRPNTYFSQKLSKGQTGTERYLCTVLLGEPREIRGITVDRICWYSDGKYDHFYWTENVTQEYVQATYDEYMNQRLQAVAVPTLDSPRPLMGGVR